MSRQNRLDEAGFTFTPKSSEYSLTIMLTYNLEVWRFRQRIIKQETRIQLGQSTKTHNSASDIYKNIDKTLSRDVDVTVLSIYLSYLLLYIRFSPATF